jgi:uncharacterized protein YeaO (DUF488 family)
MEENGMKKTIDTADLMNRIATKSVYSPIKPRRDGLRILVTRVRGRGLPKDRYDAWMPNLGPSEQLLQAFRAEQISWAEFRRRYRKELFEGGSADRGNVTIKNHGQKFTLRLIQQLARREPVTLMCHCSEDESHCHRHLLQRILQCPIK